jgi:hypothetical protein
MGDRQWMPSQRKPTRQDSANSLPGTGTSPSEPGVRRSGRLGCARPRNLKPKPILLNAPWRAVTQVTFVKLVEKLVNKESPHVALLHQLAERLTAAGNYLTGVQRRAATEARHINPPSAEILRRALAQLDQAGEILGHLRKALDDSSSADNCAGRCYRVCFLNRFARGRNTITACQRSILIPSAASREAAIEAAKQRFAELEGIPNWQIHASFIEAGLLDEDAAARREADEPGSADDYRFI